MNRFFKIGQGNVEKRTVKNLEPIADNVPIPVKHEEQRELVFHDTVPLKDEDLPKAREKAKKQNDLILLLFQQNKVLNFTPNEVHAIMVESGEHILLTSVRRSITNLTKEGRLVKCMWSERRMGLYGKDNRTWRYNTEYIKPLNSKPHFKEPKNFYEKMNP